MASVLFVGLSGDRRTNKWRFICDCGKEHLPLTTMLAVQHIECPFCNKPFVVNYNCEPVSIKEAV